MLLVSLILIGAGLVVWVRSEIQIFGDRVIRGPRASLIGRTLFTGGVLSLVLSALGGGSGIDGSTTGLMLALLTVGATLAVVSYATFTYRAEPPCATAEHIRESAPPSIKDVETLTRRWLPPAAATQLSPFSQMCLLLDRGDPEAGTLAQSLHGGIVMAAAIAGRARRSSGSEAWRANATLSHLPRQIPLGWRDDEQIVATFRQAAALERDRIFLLHCGPEMAEALHAVENASRHQQQLLSQHPDRWRVLSPAHLWNDFAMPAGASLPPGTSADVWQQDERTLADLASVAGANSTPPALAALERLVAWPDIGAAVHLRRAAVDLPTQAYVMHALALRSGAEHGTWWQWDGWLRRTETAAARIRADAGKLGDDFRDELRLLYLRDRCAAIEPALESALIQAIARHAQDLLTAAECVKRWGVAPRAATAPAPVAPVTPVAPVAPEVAPPLLQTDSTSPSAPPPAPAPSLSPAAEPTACPLTAEPVPVARTAPPPTESILARDEPPPIVVMPASAKAMPTPAAKPFVPVWERHELPAPIPAVSLWDEHLRSFLATNWYIVAGLLMVLTGASLLAYFTWDKSVLVRYLFLPLMLGAFTAGMAELGLRLSRRHENLFASGTFLLGAAVCLLPVNFIVLCRAGEDPGASGLLLPALGLYALLGGFALWRWCGSVHAELRWLLALPLLALNLLAVLGDLPGIREAAAGHRSLFVPATITAAVFLLLAVSNRFLRVVLTKELLEAKLVPWFFGVTLAATALQVSLWRHFHLDIVPRPRDYALAAILAGAALLRWERRAGELRNSGATYGGESFLGYAALLSGILMAAGHEWLRIVALLAVGAIWLAQASRRPGAVHYWIGLTFCLLGFAAFGLLEVFPKHRDLNLLPELGLALALLAGAVRALAGRRGETRLRDVAREIQPPILLLTSIVAVLSQYRVHSAAWQTGLVLLVGAGFFAVRATWENRRDWLNIAAVTAALALPYLGCADMMRYRFDANVLALGFGVLALVWLSAAAHFLRHPLWRESSGLVATCYGAAGMVGLCLRLTLAHQPELGAAELAGGALLALALGRAAWIMRFEVPAMMAAVVLAVILPLFPVPAGFAPAWLHVGAGTTSAAVAALLMFGCFALRRYATGDAPQTRGGAPVGAKPGGDTLLSVFLHPMLAALFWLAGKALLLQLQHHAVQTPYVISALLVATTLYTAAIFFRATHVATGLFHGSWPLLVAALAMACKGAGLVDYALLQYSLLWSGVALTAWLAGETFAARRWGWVDALLVQPRLQVLAYGSLVAAVLAIVAAHAPPGEHRGELQWLALFVGAQLVWHSLRTRRRGYGEMLFVLAIAWVFSFRDLPTSFGGLPVFLLGVMAADLALEFHPSVRAVLQPLRAPFVAGVTLVAPALAMSAVVSIDRIAGGALGFAHPPLQLGLLLVTLLATARTQRWAALALPAVVLGYLLLMLPATADELLRPWLLSGVALVLCALPFAGRWLTARYPALLRGASPQLPRAVSMAQAGWLVVPGLVLAVAAAIAQIAFAALGRATDPRWVQILAPFAALAAFLLAGRYWRRGALWAVGACLLPVANLFAVSVFWGRTLLDAHLAVVHLFGIAALLSIVEFVAVRRFLLRGGPATEPFARATHGLHLGCVTLAGVTLALLGVNYVAQPDLAQIPTIRFSVSGLLAAGVGLYFRFAARRPESLRTQDGLWMESLWHVALGVALWCGALAIPALRTPDAALYALALPPVVLWAVAESLLVFSKRTDENRLTGERFRGSAAVFALLILGCYVFRQPSQMLLFPSAPLELSQYHTGAAAAILMGLLLFRTRGLGAGSWTALAGGLALMTGMYFGVSWLPELSPFDSPTAGAWTAVGMAHVLILLSYQRSPLRSLIQHLGRIGDDEWHAHRLHWGWYLTATVHIAVVSALLREPLTHSLEMTPLLIALASVLVHQAIIGTPLAGFYWGLAGFEVLLALHFDFLLPDTVQALIPARIVFWFLLIPWMALAALQQRLRRILEPRQLWTAAVGLAILCAGHLLYHGPATGTGVLIATLMVLSAGATTAPAYAVGARTATALLLLSPVWLAYFGARWLTGEGTGGFRSLLAGATALLGLGMLSRLAAAIPRKADGAPDARPRRLVHGVLDLCQAGSEKLARGLLASAFAGLALLTVFHSTATSGSVGSMLALSLVWAGSCAAWFREGRHRDGVVPYVLCLLSAVGAWVLLRRLLFLHFDFWTYEYDIWLSLGASIAFNAAKRLVRHERPGLGRTMTGAVWLMPALQCGWLFTHRLGADLTLLVIGIQSMLFAWQGGGRRDSPYNGVSMLGFVGFVCLLFWAKLDLRSVQAYTIPVGLGVLGLVWLFGRHMSPALRQGVRLTAVLGMLGSCGYYALLDSSYPLGFHATMLVLCLAIMALGPILRVQLYLYLGFAGFVMDLAALVVQQFRTLDRSVQMMGVGASLLLLGVAVVGGAILYKSYQEMIHLRWRALRTRLNGWE